MSNLIGSILVLVIASALSLVLVGGPLAFAGESLTAAARVFWGCCFIASLPLAGSFISQCWADVVADSRALLGLEVAA